MKTTKYISLEALAATLKLPQKFLRELADNRKIPFLDINGRLRFNSEAVQVALDLLAAKEGANGK